MAAAHWLLQGGFSGVRIARGWQQLFIWTEDWGLFPVWLVGSHATLYHFTFLSKSLLHLSQVVHHFIWTCLSCGLPASLPVNMLLAPRSPVAFLAQVAPPLGIEGIPFGFVRKTFICLQQIVCALRWDSRKGNASALCYVHLQMQIVLCAPLRLEKGQCPNFLTQFVLNQVLCLSWLDSTMKLRVDNLNGRMMHV